MCVCEWQPMCHINMCIGEIKKSSHHFFLEGSTRKRIVQKRQRKQRRNREQKCVLLSPFLLYACAFASRCYISPSLQCVREFQLVLLCSFYYYLLRYCVPANFYVWRRCCCWDLNYLPIFFVFFFSLSLGKGSVYDRKNFLAFICFCVSVWLQASFCIVTVVSAWAHI